MKRLFLPLIYLFTLFNINDLKSQCETWNNYPQGEEEAKKQHVLYRDKLKQKNYDEAFPIWSNLFQYVKLPLPAKTTHYLDGVEMYLHFAKKDTINKLQHIEKVIDLYNQNAKCNGEDANNRAYQAYYMYSNGYDMIQSYKVFEQSLQINPNSPPPMTLLYMSAIAIKQYRLQNDSFNSDYMCNLYDEFKRIVDKNQQSKEVYYYNKYWNEIYKMFFQINEIFDCNYWTEKYGTTYQMYYDNTDTLKMISIVLSEKCGKENLLYKEVWERYKLLNIQKEIKNQKQILESDTSSVYSKIQSSRALSELDFDNKELYKNKINEVIPQLTNSTNEWIDSYTIGTELYRYAYDQYKKNNYPLARQYCRLTSKYRPSWGDPYILVGIMYASSGSICSPNTNGKGFDAQIFVWPAIDEWVKAKTIDPTSVDKANELINKYSPFIPSKVELLQRQISVGSIYTIGCWIQQNTIVRGL